MKDFAKVYGSGVSQIVIIRQSSDDGRPEVRTFFHTEDLGVCSAAVAMSDSDEGEDMADNFFDLMTEAQARKTLRELFKKMGVQEIVEGKGNE